MELTASAYTLSGSLVGAGVGEPARWPFVDRVRAAKRAGYTALGIFEADYAAMRRTGLGDQEMLDILAADDMTVEEIEFLFDWWSGDDGASEETQENLFHMAEVFRPHHLSGGHVSPPSELPPMNFVAERFAEVCDRVAPFNVNFLLEFLPWTGIPDLRTAEAIVTLAGRPNGGIILDAWHFFRGPSHLGQLSEIESTSIMAVAICDAGEPIGDPIVDTTRRRKLPGQGVFDLVELLTELKQLGIAAPISVEILSEEQASLELQDAANRSYVASLEVLKNAGYVHSEGGLVR